MYHSMKGKVVTMFTIKGHGDWGTAPFMLNLSHRQG